MSFYKWGKEKFETSNTPEGEFVRDMILHKTFPRKSMSQMEIRMYLESYGVCDAEKKIFTRMWKEYRSEVLKHGVRKAD